MNILLPITNTLSKLFDFLKVKKEKEKEHFEVTLNKKRLIALDTAEKMYFQVDSLLSLLSKLSTWKRKEIKKGYKDIQLTYNERQLINDFLGKYKKNREKFFKYNN